MYAHKGATRVVIAAYTIYIYIYAATALCYVFIYYILFMAFFLLAIYSAFRSAFPRVHYARV